MEEPYQEAFDRIERAVDGGDSDVGTLGFWRLLRRVKADRMVAAHWADAAGRIDRKAFEAGGRPRLPVWLGNAILLGGAAVFAAAIPVALAIARRSEPSRPLLSGVLVLVAGVGLSTSLHSPAHWVVGRLSGIRFLAYFVGGPPLFQPGIKVDYATYLRADPGARARMHAAGAIMSKLAPFVVFALVYLRHRTAGYDLLPAWSLWALLGFGVLQIVTDVVYSTKRSDWKKVRRELAIARSQEASAIGERRG